MDYWSSVTNFHCLTHSDDLLDSITRITPPHDALQERALGVVKIPLRTPTIRQLSARYLTNTNGVETVTCTRHHPLIILSACIVSYRYRELGRGEMQVGLDDEGGLHGVKFYLSRHNEAVRLVSHGNVMDARSYLRKGCPPSLRSNIW